MEWGIRAAAIILRTYINRYHLNTAQSIIMRWAPPSENNTSTYIQTVAAYLSYSTADPIRFTQKGRITQLLQAMARVETGILLPLSLFENGYNLAINGVGLPPVDVDAKLSVCTLFD